MASGDRSTLEQNRPLFTDRRNWALIHATSPPYINTEPLDLLIERGKWDQEALRRLCLIPAGTFQHVDYDAALHLIHDLKERRIGIVRRGSRARFARQRREKLRELQAHTTDDLLAAKRIGQEVHVDALLGRKNHGAFDDVFEFPDISRPVVIHEQLHRRRSELAQRFGILLAKAFQEMDQQEWNVLPAVAKRG